MSINRNRAKFNKAQNNKEYNILMKNNNLYCYICARRAGTHLATCAPINYRGNTSSWRFRMYRTWKYNRKKQYKTIPMGSQGTK